VGAVTRARDKTWSRKEHLPQGGVDLFSRIAFAETAAWTTDKIKATQKLQAQASEFVRTHESKIYSRELVEMIFTQPYCRIQNLVDAGIAKRQTATAASM
jgi:Fic family protein